MIKFNPENKKVLTYKECLSPAMEITNSVCARQYLVAYTVFIQKELDKKPRDDNMTAEEIAKINLGYYAGYYGAEVGERVNKLFLTTHPIFGDKRPIPEKALEIGKNWPDCKGKGQGDR